jgi:lipopolysaccharide/colanic/teichoic acid biosynthesis glycosyltransferase/glycosyltransferase involved in cell wall biosynthesis
LRGQVRCMKSKGFDVQVVSSPGASLVRFGAEQQVATHVVAMTRRITPWRDLVALWRLRGLFRRVRPHLVHGHTPKGGLLSMLAAWWSGVPVRVYHLHGLPLMTATGLRRRVLRYSEKIACFFAQQVLCVSASVRDVAVAERLCPPEKIQVLLHGSIDGVDAEKFNPARFPPELRQKTRAQYGILPDALVVGFVGRIVGDKGLLELAEAWRRIRNEFEHVHLLLIGETEPQDPLPRSVEEELRQDPRIHWAGVILDMPPLYAAMDVVVLPTYREGFPVVPLEAAAMELPVVATRIPGCVEAVQDGVAGTLVPVRDAAALANALRAYLREPRLRLEHGLAGRARIGRFFQPEQMGEALYQEYRRLLAHSASASATFYQRRGKRLLDLALTLPALILLSPLLFVLAVLVRLTLGAPILFRQQRAGRHGEPFTMWKFRSMTDERDASGDWLSDGQRLTRLGRFLRATSLDELPELLNVLWGDMSLVGPRPLYECYLPYYSPRERKRLHCRPGITGWAQINGRNALAWDERLAQDAWYVEACSLGLDLKILCITIWKVLKRADVHVVPSKVCRRLDLERLPHGETQGQELLADR